jgi:Leucine-rich repeat (LRR) protein
MRCFRGGLTLGVRKIPFRVFSSSWEQLKSLQTLNLSGCEQLSGDLAPLADLTSLQTLDLFGCEQLGGDLATVAGLENTVENGQELAT